MRTFAAIAMFLFGSTFLWLTASFSGQTRTPTGPAWTAVNVLALAAVAGFTVAAWGLYQDHAWWAVTAAVSAVLGLAAVVPFLLGMRQADLPLADMGVQINLWMHLVGSAVVMLVVWAPSVNSWFEGRLD